MVRGGFTSSDQEGKRIRMVVVAAEEGLLSAPVLAAPALAAAVEGLQSAPLLAAVVEGLLSATALANAVEGLLSAPALAALAMKEALQWLGKYGCANPTITVGGLGCTKPANCLPALSSSGVLHGSMCSLKNLKKSMPNIGKETSVKRNFQ